MGRPYHENLVTGDRLSDLMLKMSIAAHIAANGEGKSAEAARKRLAGYCREYLSREGEL